jgi:hypothetical protein
VATTPEAMKQTFARIPRSLISVETGTHPPRVSWPLTQLGHEVVVAHARNVRLIGESRRKDDRIDARMLARLARIDPQLLSPVQHRSAKAQIHFDSDSCAGRTGERSNRARQCTARIAEAVPSTVAKVWRAASEPEWPRNLSLELREVLEPLLSLQWHENWRYCCIGCSEPTDDLTAAVTSYGQKLGKSQANRRRRREDTRCERQTSEPILFAGLRAEETHIFVRLQGQSSAPELLVPEVWSLSRGVPLFEDSIREV